MEELRLNTIKSLAAWKRGVDALVRSKENQLIESLHRCITREMAFLWLEADNGLLSIHQLIRMAAINHSEVTVEIKTCEGFSTGNLQDLTSHLKVVSIAWAPQLRLDIIHESPGCTAIRVSPVLS